MLDCVNANQPSIPASKTNPVGQTRRIRRAERAVRADLRSALKKTLEEAGSWSYTVKNAWTKNVFYEFQVDQIVLRTLVASIERILSTGGGARAIQEAVAAAYREGTARTVDNLSGLSDDYPRTVLQRLADAEVLRRASFAGTRSFEQMKGFSSQTAADLGRVLFEAIQSGQNPRQTAKTIRARFGVARHRAERIARTEITMAHRRGRWDEARDAEEKFGIKTMLLHNSALIAGRTRLSHAARHGKLFTREQEAAWYSVNGNAIHCLCSQTEVVVDKDGKPLFGEKLIERMSKARQQFLAAGVQSGDLD